MSALSRLEATTKRRDDVNKGWERLIRLAASEGHSLRKIAAAAGVTHGAIAKKLQTTGSVSASTSAASARSENTAR